MWAEKEMHNLLKMSKFGILVPDVVLLRKHILLMSFIGHDGKPAPKLKDAHLSEEEVEQVKNNWPAFCSNPVSVSPFEPFSYISSCLLKT